MKEKYFMFLFKELYFPEIYRQFSTIQQNIIFIESIARCGKGNTQENIQENIQQDIQLNIQENIQQNIQKKNILKHHRHNILQCGRWTIW